MKKRWIALMLTMVILLLPGCQAAQPEEAKIPEPQEEPLTWMQKTDPVTLTILSGNTNKQDPDKPKSQNPPLWGEDPVSRYIMDITGVKLDQVGDGSGANLDTILASNEWADLYSARMYTVGVNYPLEDSTLCYSLDELAAQYCPDFWDDTDPIEMLNNTASDGHIYTLRGGYLNADIYDDPSVPVYAPYTMSINTKWLEKLDAKMPESIEELEVLLYQWKELGEEMGIILYPMLMGDAVTSPLASWMGVLEDTYWDAEEKMVRTPLRQNAWVDYLALLSRWYRDGVLILPKPEELPNYDSYDTEYDEWAKTIRFTEMESWLHGRSSIACVTSSATERYEHSISLGKGTEPHDKFKWQVLIDPLAHEGAVKRVAQDNGAYQNYQWGSYTNKDNGLFITKKCTNPERAILFYQFLKSEDGAKLTHWGIEGIHYEKNSEGKPIHLEGYRAGTDGFVDACFVTPEESYAKIRWKGICYWDFVPNTYVRSAYYAVPESFNDLWEVNQIRAQLNEAGLKYKKDAWENKNPVLQLAEPAVGSDDYNTYEAIYDKWLRTLLVIITESRDNVEVQQRWDDLMSELYTMGLDQYEESMTIRFTDALKRYHAAGYYKEIQP